MRAFGRLGFLGRVVLIILLLQLALIALAAAVDFALRESRRPLEDRFPVPRQAAAIVELLDVASEEARARALRAVRSPELDVEIRAAPPPRFDEGRRMPGVEWLVGQYLETMPERAVLATPSESAAEPTVRVRERVLIAVELRTGGYAVFRVRGANAGRVFGAPPGFFIGVLGCLFAALALWAIAREARPLRRLSEAVEAFAAAGRPQLTDARGAPELRRLIEAVNAMQVRISGLIWGRTVMLGAVSHDLKTYITRLRLRAEAIAEPENRAKVVADLDEMTELIDDAIAVARGASETARREPVDLARLLRDEAAARPEAALRLEIASDAEAATLDADPVGLRRLVANLIDNALRYGSRAEIGLTRSAGRVILTVDDDGPGVPEDARADVFEPFWRGETSRSRATGGAGLGLAIVKQIAEAHGAELAIETGRLGGARFVVVL